MMIGMLLSIAVLVTFLAWVNRKHVELQEARGAGQSAHATPRSRLVLVAQRRALRSPGFVDLVLRLQRLEPDAAEHLLLRTSVQGRARSGAIPAPGLV